MRPLRTIFVEPRLPARIGSLWELAHNLRWSWDHVTWRLFAHIDPELWKACEGNPVRFLGALSSEQLEALAADDSFCHQLDAAAAALEAHLSEGSTWFRRHSGDRRGGGLLTAYFSAEFGLTDALQVFSGGLGILAGDHLKSSSDMGVPLVGVGLAYQHGYFRQYLSPDGWQQERYPSSDFHTMPVRQVLRADGSAPLEIEVPLGLRSLRVLVWEVLVGRNRLLLLDANHPANPPEDREITSHLYGGDQEMRIRQELVLGIGGVLVLEALGLRPRVFHINEGHAAFLALARIRAVMRETGVDFAAAREITASQLVFTTHTPVPAGIDVFPEELVRRYLGGYAGELSLTIDQLLDLGREQPGSAGFNMAVLALRLSHAANGVSRLHGDVSRHMWAELWPGFPPREVPIDSVTNGVHLPTWVSLDMAGLLDRYLGPRWRDDHRGEKVWSRLDAVPAEELWRTHERRRERLVAFARRRAAEQLRSQGASPDRVREARDILDPDALTLGFARRFAPYKRATLLLSDPDRLVQLLSNRDRPMQLLFAGKAHPRDHFGKDLVRQIVQFSRRPEVAGRVLFLEDYDIQVARYMVQGVDVWLNTPRVPKEASGTSGMKAAVNGALQVSTRDGWWAEVADEGIGWTIGRGEIYPEDQHPHQDLLEARLLYDLLEREVAPLFYDRGRDGLPLRWIERMRSSMRIIGPRYDSGRMVREYVTRFYLPAAARFGDLSKEDGSAATALSAWRSRIEAGWHEVRGEGLEWAPDASPRVGDEAPVALTLHLGSLGPRDVRVELLHGRVTGELDLDGWSSVVLTQVEELGGGRYLFRGACPFIHAGRSGFAFRVLPDHPLLPSPAALRLVRIVDNLR